MGGLCRLIHHQRISIRRRGECGFPVDSPSPKSVGRPKNARVSGYPQEVFHRLWSVWTSPCAHCAASVQPPCKMRIRTGNMHGIHPRQAGMFPHGMEYNVRSGNYPPFIPRTSPSVHFWQGPKTLAAPGRTTLFHNIHTPYYDYGLLYTIPT